MRKGEKEEGREGTREGENEEGRKGGREEEREGEGNMIDSP